MDIEAFLLCDAATDQQGNLNILGAFDTVFSNEIPFNHPACAVAARIRFEKIEEGNHPIKIHVIDEDGGAILPRLDAQVSVKVGDDVGSAVTNLVLHMQRLNFTKYGRFRIDLAVDGQIRASLPLFIRRPPT